MQRPGSWKSPKVEVEVEVKARRAWATILVFLFPLLSLVTGFGIGVAGFLASITALCWWRDARPMLRRHWPRVRWVVLAFLLHAGCTAFLVGAMGRPSSLLDGPLRMCLILPAMLVVRIAQPPLRALWLGAAGGALAGAGFVAWQALALGNARPGGLLNPITFGDLALCLGLVALTGLADGASRAGRALAAVGALGALGGLAASLLTGSRGGWVVVPVAIGLLCGRRALLPRRVRLALPVLACVFAAMAYAVPQTGVRDRIGAGTADLRLYLTGELAYSSLGVRLELWRAGLRLARLHPLAGMDRDAYERQMQAWIDAGQLSPIVFAPPRPPHLHNDALQMLVTRGLPGLLAWAGILLAPLAFFRARLRATAAPGACHGAALAGMLVVLAYAGFGLTEVIFWSMKANGFYALMVCLLMGWCLDGEAGRQPAVRARPETVQAGHASRP